MRLENPNSLATVDLLSRDPLNCSRRHGNRCSIAVVIVYVDGNLKREAMPGWDFNLPYLRFVNALQEIRRSVARKSPEPYV
jgi:hypothetical protein